MSFFGLTCGIWWTPVSRWDQCCHFQIKGREVSRIDGINNTSVALLCAWKYPESIELTARAVILGIFRVGWWNSWDGWLQSICPPSWISNQGSLSDFCKNKMDHTFLVLQVVLWLPPSKWIQCKLNTQISTSLALPSPTYGNHFRPALRLVLDPCLLIFYFCISGTSHRTFGCIPFLPLVPSPGDNCCSMFCYFFHNAKSSLGWNSQRRKEEIIFLV